MFVGYGITAPEADYDDYAGLDVKGKVVVAMRWAPGRHLQEKGTGGPVGRKPVPALYQELRFKAMNARDHGAAALVIFNGVRSEGGAEDALIKLGATQGQDDSGIPVLQVIRPVFEELLGAEKLREAQGQIDTTFTPRSFAAPETVPPFKIQTALDRERKEVSNVVGVIEGSDPARKGEWVVVGARHDHLGKGPRLAGARRSGRAPRRRRQRLGRRRPLRGGGRHGQGPAEAVGGAGGLRRRGARVARLGPARRRPPRASSWP
ncbi:MAG: hypothetical protein MZU95_03320 [Desulfomicrobium escambiense]|nr:hypothetical protein [Desulfomicrobium escambiense]